MLIYPHAVIVRKAANESINISAMNLISSNDRADNPMEQLKDEYCLKKWENTEYLRIVFNLTYRWCLKKNTREKLCNNFRFSDKTTCAKI